jgi:transcriptional regulator with XRE-family HTH domain
MTGSIGDNIKKFRKLNNLTQKELSQLLREKFSIEVGQSAISQYEKGIISANFDMIQKIADILNVSVDDLVEETNPEKKTEKEISNIKEALLDAYYERDRLDYIVDSMIEQISEDPKNDDLKKLLVKHQDELSVVKSYIESMSKYLSEIENDNPIRKTQKEIDNTRLLILDLNSKKDEYINRCYTLKQEVSDDEINKIDDFILNAERKLEILKDRLHDLESEAATYEIFGDIMSNSDEIETGRKLLKSLNKIRDENREKRLLDLFNLLNPKGKEIAIQRIEELTFIKQYTSGDSKKGKQHFESLIKIAQSQLKKGLQLDDDDIRKLRDDAFNYPNVNIPTEIRTLITQWMRNENEKVK